MTTSSRQQRGLRLSDPTWTGIRIAAVQAGVSASSLVEALGEQWIRAHESQTTWALLVIDRAKTIQTQMVRARSSDNGQNAEKVDITAENAEI